MAKEIWTDVAKIFNFRIPCNMSELSALWCADNKEKSVVGISSVAVV